MFILKHPDIIVNHLRRIRSQPENGEVKYQRLFKDLSLNESNFKCSLLPESMKNGDSVKVFTEEEAFEDLASWG